MDFTPSHFLNKGTQGSLKVKYEDRQQSNKWQCLKKTIKYMV